MSKIVSWHVGCRWKGDDLGNRNIEEILNVGHPCGCGLKTGQVEIHDFFVQIS